MPFSQTIRGHGTSQIFMQERVAPTVLLSRQQAAQPSSRALCASRSRYNKLSELQARRRTCSRSFVLVLVLGHQVPHSCVFTAVRTSLCRPLRMDRWSKTATHWLMAKC
ncbi:hypothetical protein P153DRAFT_200667 [Dothidotthia symphoricarpi CBS 119687]|uniref:Uncharacterized protein n=1 Tax=Dothidotthia symphoricarpi CBS 119687 TaxID=1392245 RepID=A0A6A6AIM8_9PLEO|nr:uncharacterized protein P153DRAFT_200667 [Dothidotthia symphoricarpi CBS 119687]KAF2131660.1 hypothetical protein P153DRAFT_200667 [Dothidotthia symphoricarpi CBS 119687]